MQGKLSKEEVLAKYEKAVKAIEHLSGLPMEQRDAISEGLRSAAELLDLDPVEIANRDLGHGYTPQPITLPGAEPVW